MNKCAVCNSDMLKNIENNYCDFSISSDNRIIKSGIELYQCKQCGHLQKEVDSKVVQFIYSSYCTDSVEPNMEISLVGGGE